MSFVDSTHWMAQLAELRSNRDEADVTLNCQGEVVKAHSFILGIRSEYFKTALNTSVGNNNKVLKVDECSPHVLATAVDFIYGIGIPGDFGSEDAKSLLAMADLYLMEDLKNAVGCLIATKHTNKYTILEVSQMAEKYSAQKLKEWCCEFIFKNLKTLDEKVLMELYETLPLLGNRAWQERVKGTNQPDTFKKRGDFQSEVDYKLYLITHMKPGILVTSNRRVSVPVGTIGRVLSFDIIKGPQVQWSDGFGTSTLGRLIDLDLFTSPTFNE